MATVSDVYTIYANTGQLDDATRKLAMFKNQVDTTGAGIGGLRTSGGQGAQGILMLSQTIDDAQYGFRSIVNNIPQLGTALGEKLGMGTENAMKFAGAMGLLAVAVNLNLKHMETWQGLGTDLIEKAFGKEGVETLTGSLWNLAGALNSVVETASFGTISFSSEESRRVADEEAKKAKEKATGTKAFEAAQKDIDEEAQARGKAFAAAVKGTEGGGGAITKQLARNLRKSLGLSEDDAQAMAGNIYLGAGQGNERDIKQIAGMMGEGFKDRFQEATPEGQALQKKREEESVARAKEAEELDKAEWAAIEEESKNNDKRIAKRKQNEEKEAKEAAERLAKLPDALADVPEAENRLAMAGVNLREKLLGGPAERIGATDFARQAEGKGADLGRQQLEVEQAILEVDRETLNVLKAQNNVAVLSK
jgi:hypothetical protein